MLKIIDVVLAVDDGIVDGRILAVNPADGVLAGLSECLKVHLEGENFFNRLGGFGRFSRAGSDRGRG